MGKRFATIAGLGSALPERVVPNSYFERFTDTSDQWIRDRTGVRERRFAAPDQQTSDLAAEAAREALASTGLAPEQVDVLIVATFTPDRLLPATAVIAQARLGISCPAFDLNAACAGYSYALAVASSLIEAGAVDRALVIGAEVLSRVLDLTDRTTCILFGDGAAATVLVPSESPGIVANVLAADGTAAELITIPAGGVERPASEETVAQRAHAIRMPAGREVFRRAVLAMVDACTHILEKSGVRPEEVDLLVPHQANARIMAAVAERLGVGPDRILSDIETVGNTSAASIPLALDRAWRTGRVRPGDLVLAVSFGAGLAWGANLIRWTADAP